MKQGLLPYGVEVVEAADTVTARGGLALAVEAMRALGVSRAIKQQVRIRQRARGRDEVAAVRARRWRYGCLAEADSAEPQARPAARVTTTPPRPATGPVSCRMAAACHLPRSPALPAPDGSPS